MRCDGRCMVIKNKDSRGRSKRKYTMNTHRVRQSEPRVSMKNLVGRKHADQMWHENYRRQLRQQLLYSCSHRRIKRYSHLTGNQTATLTGNQKITVNMDSLLFFGISHHEKRNPDLLQQVAITHKKTCYSKNDEKALSSRRSVRTCYDDRYNLHKPFTGKTTHSHLMRFYVLKDTGWLISVSLSDFARWALVDLSARWTQYIP